MERKYEYALKHLFRTHAYPGYQFYCRMKYADGRDSRECLCWLSNEVCTWLQNRVGEEIDIPDLLAKSEVTGESSNFHFSEGFAVDSICLPDEKAWAMMIREPDNGDRNRAPVVGRFFVTDIGLKQSDDIWVEMGIRINILEPENAEELAHAYRPAFVRNIFKNEDLIIEQVAPLSMKATEISTESDLLDFRLVLEDKENQLPLIVFTPTYNQFSIDEILEELDRQTKGLEEKDSLMVALKSLNGDKKLELGMPSYPYDKESFAGKVFAYGRAFYVSRALFETFREYCSKLQLEIEPGDVVFFPSAESTANPILFSYADTAGKSALIEDNFEEIVEKTRAYSKRVNADFGQVKFSDELSEIYRRKRLEELKKSSQDSEEWYAELLQTETRLEELEDECKRLKSQNASLRALEDYRKANRENSVTLQITGLEEFYEDEVYDLIISVLDDAKNKYCAENSRAHEIIQALLNQNQLAGNGKEIFEKLKIILFRGSNVSERDLADIKKLGFEIVIQGNNHIQLLFNGDKRYSDVLPSTGSDWRGLKNSYSQLMNRISVYKNKIED